jgi:hypothetical protein
MNARLLPIAILVSLVVAANLGAQDSKKPATAEKPKDSPPPSNPGKPKRTTEELETQFKETLTMATLAGRWCTVQDGRLGPSKEEKYTIDSVTKVGGDLWLIKARIQYGKMDFVAPIPVQVKWAGDTPVIILDKVGIPGSGEYSARVLIFEKTYAGTWSGGDHGGLLNGVIKNQEERNAAESK